MIFNILKLSRKIALRALAVSFGLLITLFFLVEFFAPVDLNPKAGSRLVLAADGTPLRAFADDDGVWRYPVKFDDVSELYIEALISYEDHYFYQHPGLNPLALIRAFWQAIRYQQIVSGGSTLTMQVARMRYPEKRTLGGKLKEIVRALQLELHFSKQEILTYYLNHAPFGGTIEGVQAAALTYFGYDAKDLTHAQAALLAVLPQAPTRYRPDRNAKEAQAARDKVLDRMVSNGTWHIDTVTDAKQETVIAIPKENYQQAPLLARRLANASKEPLVKTFIDRHWQASVERLVQQYVQGIETEVSAAVMIMESRTGEVRVYVGSADFTDDNRSGHVDIVPAIRSPGSTLKPFIYGLAFDAGLLHSESLLMNVPLRFADYQPDNFSGGFSGPESVADSLTKSLNVPAVQVLERIGPVALYLSMQTAGAKLALPGNGRPSLAIALGGLGTNLESLIRLYSALDNDGRTQKPRLTISDEAVSKPLLSKGSAWMTRAILVAAENAPSGIAVKTGTSYGFRDSWAIAVVDGFTIGVWVGKPDGTPLTGHYGRQTAVPLLVNAILPVVRHNELPKKPDSVTSETICWPTGRPEPLDKCDEQRTAWVLDGVFPNTWMQIVTPNALTVKPTVALTLSKDQHQQVPFGCEIDAYQVEKVIWPLPLQHWLIKKLRSSERIPNFDNRCDQRLIAGAALPVKISGIRAGDSIVVEDDGSSFIDLSAEGGQAPYFWYINDELQEERSNQFRLYPESQFTYDIVLMDYHGQIDRQQLNAR